jgi:DNA repair exonuclease SbcCD ATPase subunit
VSAPAEREAGSLAEAAAALEEELAGLEAVAREASRSPLTSRKALDRSAARLADLADADARLSPRLEALTAAFARVAARQGALAEAVRARAAEIEDRRAALAALLERHDALGRGAAEVNAVARGLQARLAGEGGAPAVIDLVPMVERLEALVDGARSLSEAAQESGFADVASEVHALEQQLLAARNQIKLAGERMRDAAEARG